MFSLEHLQRIRAAEIEVVAKRLHPGARILELGAGTGQQSLALSERGFDVSALDIEQSDYAQDRVFPVINYDGEIFPFESATFDVVFSSNVLEHIANLDSLHREVKRVLRPNGYCVHVLPTDAWRLWTTLAAFPASFQYLAELKPDIVRFLNARTGLPNQALTLALRSAAFATIPIRQRRHGERGNLITEQWYFRPAWWRRHFIKHGFNISYEAPMGLFYTGHMVWPSLSLKRRALMAKTMGSACHLFELRPAISV